MEITKQKPTTDSEKGIKTISENHQFTKKDGKRKRKKEKTIPVKHPDNNEQNGIRKFVPVNNSFICEQIKFSNKKA